MATSAEHRSKVAALYRRWWRLNMSEKISTGTKNPKQTNQNKELIKRNIHVKYKDICNHCWKVISKVIIFNK